MWMKRQFTHVTFIILRPRGLFGAHDRVIIPRLLRQLEADRGVLRLPRGGEALLDLTWVGNVVHAMRLATDTPGLISGEAFNITNHEPQRLAMSCRSGIGWRRCPGRCSRSWRRVWKSTGISPARNRA